MVRTVITPEKTDVHLTVPENYIGKEIEVLLYLKEEVNEEQPVSDSIKMSSFKGLLNEEEASELQEYVKKSRAEWDREHSQFVS
jgi:hypothetical protein